MTGVYGIPHGAALGIFLKPVCVLMGESDIAELIEEPNYNYSYDIDSVIELAKGYKKFDNTSQYVDTDKLKEVMNGYTN